MAKIRFPRKIIPPVYPSVFERPRLLDLLSENQHSPLAWVYGSPGSGKTTLVSSWLQQQQARILWYRMDNDVNVSADLFYFLSLSAHRNYPRKRFKLPVFTAEYADDIKSFAIIFFRQLFAVLKQESAIVFDNCQEIERDVDFLSILQIALNNMPEGLQIICISRNRPAHLLSRLSLSGDLLNISPALLRFTNAESAEFISWLNPDINAQTSAALQLKAQGWAVALVLLSQKNPDALQTPADINNHQDAFGFLMAEILANMDQASLRFMAKTAVFTQFTVTMAIALTGYRNARDALDNLVHKNFLIERSDETHPEYVFHPLLRELLNQQCKSLLSDEQLSALYRSAVNILIEQNNIEDALPFYVLLQDWSELRRLLLKHSEQLLNQGRHHLLITWMEYLPQAMLSNDPWLLYWYAVAIKPIDPNRATELLDQCYQQFVTVKDVLGLYSAWQVAVEAINISLDDFSRLKVWFQRFDELREHYPGCPSFELKLKFSVTALQALTFYNPQHPWFNKLLKISEYGFRYVPVKLIQQLICSQLGNYYCLTHELTKLQVLEPCLLSTLNDESLPAFPRIFNAHLVGSFLVIQGNSEDGLSCLEKGLEISSQQGLSLFKPLINFNLVFCHICRGDLASVQSHLDNNFTDISPKQRMLVSLYHFYAAWNDALNNRLPEALEQTEQALLICQLIENEFGTVCCLGLKVRLLAETSQWEMADKVLLLLANVSQHSPNKFYQLQYHLSDAWIGYQSNNQKQTLAGIKQFLSLASGEQIKFFLGWQPNVISSLCLLAIEHEIHAPFALSMLQLNGLCAPPPRHLEQWPWPVRIYCFNHPQIELNGQTLKQEGKSQKKVIELLLTIIALGGKDIYHEQVCETLWPDSDGDLAHQALETAIARLRKLIGKPAVVVKEGRLSLSQDYCWVDVLVFESTLEELGSTLQNEPDEALLLKLSKRLFHLYQPPGLNQLDSGVVIAKQKQLQSHFILVIKRLISHYEKQREHGQLCTLLEQSLERASQPEFEHKELISYYDKKIQEQSEVNVI